VFAPEAMDNVRAIHGDRLSYARTAMEALEGADCLVIVTEWGDFRRPDFDDVARRMKGRVIIDGRNLYQPQELARRGFTYHGIGKLPVHGG
jgi:UDPglucose 6-dehydrogenase